MSSIWSIDPGLLTFPFLLNDCFTSFSSFLKFPKPSLLSPLSASDLAFYLTRKLEALRGRCSDCPHGISLLPSICVYIFCLSSAHQSPWFSECGPGPAASGALGTCKKCRFTGHITELCLNKPLGNSDAGARLTNTAWEKPTISYIKGQPFVFPIPSALLKGVALARPPFSPKYIMNLPLSLRSSPSAWKPAMNHLILPKKIICSSDRSWCCCLGAEFLLL